VRPPGTREQTLLLCALIGSAQMTWGVVVPVVPLYLDVFAIPLAVLGPVVAAFAVGRAIANVPAGLLLRILPARRYAWVVALALAATTAATGLVPDAGWLIVARLIAGLLGGAVVTVGFATLVAGAPAAARGRVMATATIVQMSAAAVGALIGGLTVDLLGIPPTFAIAAVPLLACLGWDAVRPARMYWGAFSAPAAPPARDDPTPRPGPILAVLCLVAFATFFVRFAGEQGLVPVLAYDTGGLTPVTLGVAMAAGTVLSLATMPLVGRLVDRGVRGMLLLPAAIVGAVALAALPGLGTPWAFGLAVVAYSVATSAVNVVPGVITAEAFPTRHVGSVVGLTRTAGDVGAAAGPLVVFGLAAIVGTWAACAALALVLLVAILVFAGAIRRRRPAAAAKKGIMTTIDPAADGVHRADGRVVPGAQRGREMGFPTANLDVAPGTTLPADGVYLGWFRLTGSASATGALPEGVSWPALVSVGTNPTFAGDARTVEAYLLDFDDDLYGRHAHVVLDRLLRRQEAFDSLDALVTAMQGDEREARRLLAEAGHRLPYVAGSGAT
jgi:MFS transporter, DHA1 family, multidrug resistance protein